MNRMNEELNDPEQKDPEQIDPEQIDPEQIDRGQTDPEKSAEKSGSKTLEKSGSKTAAKSGGKTKTYHRAVLPVEPLDRRDEKAHEKPRGDASDEEVLAKLEKPDLTASMDDQHLRENIGTQHQMGYVSEEQAKLSHGVHGLYWVFASPVRLIAISFAALILIGGLLLTLPIASRSGEWTSFLTGIFTSTSAVCVTGLILEDTGTYWSAFGHTVIITLIQLGGIGLVTVVASFFALSKRKMNIRTLRAVQDATGSDSVAEVYSLAKAVVAITLSFELVGGLILSWRYAQFMPIGSAFYAGMFQGVSAFCNAGFDLLGPWTGRYSSMTYMNGDPIITVTSALLLTFGGMGFIVWLEIFKFPKTHKLSFHSKLVLKLTATILIIGTVLFMVLEWSNTGDLAMGTLPVWQRPFAAFFQTATLRTAGFNSINQNNLRDVSKLLSCLVMYIGASPVSTGGGMKTTTFAIVFATIKSNVLGKKAATLNKHQIGHDVFTRAFVIFTLLLVVAFSSTFIITITEREALAAGRFSTLDIMFEVFSALCTVGVTSIQTENLQWLSTIPLMLCMYIGRVGPFSIALLLSMRNQKQENVVLPEGLTFVG